MDSDFDPDFSSPPPSHTTTQKNGSFWGDFFGGHHSSTYTTPVPEGSDPNKFSRKVNRAIGKKPAPMSPENKVTEVPQKTKTIGQPSWVSQASSEDRHDNSVDVMADPDHILGGKDGSSGITYSSTPQQGKDGSWSVKTEKESYGDGKYPVLNPLRAMIGRYVLDPHIENQIETAYKKEEGKKKTDL